MRNNNKQFHQKSYLVFNMNNILFYESKSPFVLSFLENCKIKFDLDLNIHSIHPLSHIHEVIMKNLQLPLLIKAF